MNALVRWRGRRLLWMAVALAGIVAAGVGWLFGSEAGLRFALARVAAAWPAWQLQVAASEGRLAGPLRLRGVTVQLPGQRVQVADLRLDWQPARLLWAELALHSLQLDNIVCSRAPVAVAGAPPTLPGWRWPDLRLPLTLRIAQLQLGRLQMDGVEQWQSLELAGDWQRDGRIALARLQLQRADAEASVSGAVPGRLDWQVQQGAAPPLRGTVSIDAQALQLQASIGDRASAEATLDAQARWRLRIRLQAADLRPWWSAAPPALDLRLDADGDADGGRVTGALDWAPWALDAVAAEFAWLPAQRRLQLRQLQLQPRSGGRVQASGDLDLGALPALDLQAQLQALALPGESAPRFDGHLRAHGALEALRLELDGELSRDRQHAALQVHAQREGADWRIDQARIDGAPGVLQLSGRYRSATSAVQAQLHAERFDPAWLDPRLRGRVQARADLSAQATAGQWRGHLRLHELGGDWLGHPLRGDGELQLDPAGAVHGNLRLSVGRSRVQLRADAPDSLLLRLQPLRLQEIWPQTSGNLQGELRLPSWRRTAVLQLDLQASDLRLAGLRLAQAQLRGRLTRQAAAGGEFAADWRGLQLAEGLAIDGRWRSQGGLDGYRAELALRAAAGDSSPRQLDARWQGGHADGAGFVAVDDLQASDPQAGSWRLRAPGRIDYGRRWRAGEHCLDSPPAALCLSLAGDAEPQLHWRLTRLPLARVLGRWLSNPGLHVDGALDASATLQRTAAGWQPQSLRVELDAGGLRRDEPEPITLLRWQRAQAQGVLADGRFALEATADLGDDGHLAGSAALPWQAQPQFSAADARVRLDLRRLPALQLFAPDLVQADGRLSGELRWQAAAAAPLQGAVELAGLRGNLPALGLVLGESSLTLRSDCDRLAIDGVLHSGGGPIRVEGALAPGEAVPARLRIAATDALLADTRQLRLVASPDLQAQWRQGRLRLRGSVAVPSARIDLERLESGAVVSSDVQVLDPRKAESAAAALPLDADIDIELGEQVRLAGFGFDGGIRGHLRVRERPGRVAEGRGSLELRGDYRAYGQDLAIQRGRLLFAGGALDNPGIDLRASRKVQEVEVGIAVRGAARRPQLSLWSQPPLDQAEALSYLVLGRPLRSASSADGAQLGQAAAAMGGNLLAAQLGGRLGLDTFGVADSRSLGGAAFTVGKYLSPRLYLSYGVALFDSGTAVTLKYLLTERLDVEVETAHESRAAINYRIERD